MKIRFHELYMSWLIPQETKTFSSLPLQDESALLQTGFYALFGKRYLDIVITIFAIILLLPLVILFLTITALDGKSPLFGHRRIGKNGSMFKCWKIRTMVSDAEDALEALFKQNPEAQKEWNKGRKLSNDPRVTRLGKFLRKFSIDELPQLWNVLIGEMSIVGPRPVVKDELDQLYAPGDGRSAYLEMRPGITGLWQVSGRNKVSYDDRVMHDIKYRNDCSLMKDLQIIFKTFGAVINRTGM